MDPINPSEFRHAEPFNGAVEIGLRALALLTVAFPTAYSLQRLVVFDYLVVHSDDMLGGPPGLHPKTPRRSGELLVRRGALQRGLLLYQSRGLVAKQYMASGVYYSATDRAAAFLDVLTSPYVHGLRERADWVVTRFGELADDAVSQLASAHLGEWGAEFAMESVLWEEGAS